jgi:hypothetical protein
MTCPDDYNVVFVRFPDGIDSAVRIDPDGYPTFYIDARLTFDARRRALRHELAHYFCNDFFSTDSIRSAERRAAACARTIRKRRKRGAAQ